MPAGAGAESKIYAGSLLASRGGSLLASAEARGLLTRRAYTASAIAMALVLWCVLGASAHEVRARVAVDCLVGATAAGERWSTLLRWARVATSGRLFGGAPVRAEGTLRQRARRGLAPLERALADTGLDDITPAQAFFAAHHVGRGTAFG
jgi:hypothetical protein